MPVYNGQQYLSDAVDSVLEQTFRDFILVISDNASTDSTQQICEEYARRDARVRYVRQDTNRGAVWNFNEVARLSATPLFAWLCADDCMCPTYLEVCVSTLDVRTEAIVVYTEAISIDERGNALPYSLRALPVGSPRVAERFSACLAPFLYGENVLYGVMKTSAVRQTRVLGPFGGSDRAFLAELSLYGPFARVDQALFRRRVPDVGRSEAEVQKYNTGQGRRLSLREWRILGWNLQSVWRAPAGGRAPLYRAVMRRLFKQRGLYFTELAMALKGLVTPVRQTPPG